MKHKAQNGIFYNWQKKIICLILAVIIYVAFSLGIVQERRISLPLNIVFPIDLTVTSEIPSNAEVVIKGNEKNIYMIDVEKLSLVADFSGVHNSGVASIPIHVDYDEMLDYIDTSEITIYTDPSFVKLYFE